MYIVPSKYLNTGPAFHNSRESRHHIYILLNEQKRPLVTKKCIYASDTKWVVDVVEFFNQNVTNITIWIVKHHINIRWYTKYCLGQWWMLDEWSPQDQPWLSLRQLCYLITTASVNGPQTTRNGVCSETMAES